MLEVFNAGFAQSSSALTDFMIVIFNSETLCSLFFVSISC